MDKMKLKIMVVENKKLFSKYSRETKFYPWSEYDFEKNILEDHEYMERGIAENNYNYKQPIPYGVVVNSKNEIFVYTRWWKDSNAWEERMYWTISIWVWGHLDYVDKGENLLKEWLIREIEEEIGIKKEEILGVKNIWYINNESNSVNKVHFGIAYVINIGGEVPVKLLDWELEKGDFLSIQEFERRCSLKKYDIEPWSKLLLEPMNNYFKSIKLEDDFFYIKNLWFTIENEQETREYLEKVWLHRLKRYLNVVTDYKWQDFQKIIDAYLFDKELRLLNLQVIEIVEKFLKNMLILHIWNPLNKSIYTSKSKKRLMYNEKRIIWLKYDDIECEKNFYNDGILDFELFYDNLTFWEISFILKDLSTESKYKISKKIWIPKALFESWIWAIWYLRNLSSHWKNIFNKKMTRSLKWRVFTETFWTEENASYISYFFILDLLSRKLTPDMEWVNRVFDVMDSYWIKLTDFTSKKEIPHIEHESEDSEAWEILVAPLYKKYLDKSN